MLAAVAAVDTIPTVVGLAVLEVAARVVVLVMALTELHLQAVVAVVVAILPPFMGLVAEAALAL